jgi:predicted alpha/beta-hydrolase family hydrolase
MQTSSLRPDNLTAMTVYTADRPEQKAGAGAPALLVLAHGAGAGEKHPYIVRHARGLAARGIDVVTFDFPYMQAGRKAPDKAPVLEDAFRRAIVEATSRPEFRDHRVFIGGKSMGGRMATHVAASPADWPTPARALAGVIVFGYPLNPPGGPSKRSPDRVSHLARITVPTLIVQGTRDNFGGPADIQNAMPHAQVHALAGADHSPAAKFDQDVCDRVAAFVSST